MEQPMHDTKISKSVFLFVIAVFAIFLVYSLSEFFTAFLGSIVFYVLFKPWMEFFVKKKNWRKSMAAILVIVVSFFIIMLPIIFFTGMLYNKIVMITSRPEDIVNYITQIQLRFNITILNEKNISEAKSFAASTVPNILNTGLSVFSSITMMYFFMYFLLINFNRLEALLVLVLPFNKLNVVMFGSELQSQTFSNAIGIPLIAVAQGSSAFFIYYVAGIPESAFWGILTGFASIVPIVGTGIIWVPICIFLFANGNTWQGAAVLGWSVVIMGSADNVIRFMLAKRMADVHPVVTVLGVIMGLNYMGVPGLIFGPLLISYFIILVKIYYSRYRKGVELKYEKKVTKPFQIPFFLRKK